MGTGQEEMQCKCEVVGGEGLSWALPVAWSMECVEVSGVAGFIPRSSLSTELWCSLAIWQSDGYEA